MRLVAPERPRPLTGGEPVASLEARLGVTFDDATLLLAALTHPSYANEHPDEAIPTNERLEFLGDAALSLVISQTLYDRFPAVHEGRLTEWRAQLVCGPTLSRVATEILDLGRWLRLGRGEELTGGRTREGNLERAYEAVIGAVYLDRGLETARRLILDTLGPDLALLERDPGILNPKGTLQELAQEQIGRPEYVVIAQDGPEHHRRFTVEVRLRGEAMGRGSGASRQEAEKAAAAEALPRLREHLAGTPGRGAGRGAGAHAAGARGAPSDAPSDDPGTGA